MDFDIGADAVFKIRTNRGRQKFGIRIKKTIKTRATGAGWHRQYLSVSVAIGKDG